MKWAMIIIGSLMFSELALAQLCVLKIDCASVKMKYDNKFDPEEPDEDCKTLDTGIISQIVLRIQYQEKGSQRVKDRYTWELKPEEQNSCEEIVEYHQNQAEEAGEECSAMLEEYVDFFGYCSES